MLNDSDTNISFNYFNVHHFVHIKDVSYCYYVFSLLNLSEHDFFLFLGQL